jgi:hypothetical protein
VTITADAAGPAEKPRISGRFKGKGIVWAMNKRNALIMLACILLLVLGYRSFSGREREWRPETTDRHGTKPELQQRRHAPVKAAAPQAEQHRPVAEEPAYHPRDIEEIKRQVYDLNIEYVDDIHLLDSVIQTGDAPTKDLWQGGWASVDDNKEEVNGFRLEPQDDGTFIFYPDEATTRTYTFFETPKTYTYDPAKREFSWEIDYYGKTISHRVRFINDNVVAMMLISGSKVSLDLYQKQPDRPAQDE